MVVRQRARAVAKAGANSLTSKSNVIATGTVLITAELIFFR